MIMKVVSYQTRLLKLKLLPLMYLFELQDVLFAIKSLNEPTNQFSITKYITFSSASTRSGTNNNMQHLNNMSRHSYFHRLPNLWNALPIIDIKLPFHTIKSQLKSHLYSHFTKHFDSDNNCTLHCLCPCSTCHQVKPPTINLNYL